MENLSGVTFSSLPHSTQVSVLHLASSLSSLFAGMGASEEVWTVGQLSNIIGGVLENLPQT